MPAKTPLLLDSIFDQQPPCERCAAPTILTRLTPADEAGRFVRTFECPKCGTTFDTTDESDAEIQIIAERMTGSAQL